MSDQPSAKEIVIRILQSRINKSYSLGLKAQDVREEMDRFCTRTEAARRSYLKAIKSGAPRDEAFASVKVTDLDPYGLEHFKPSVIWEAQQIVYPRNRLTLPHEAGQYRNLFGYKDPVNEDKKRQKEFAAIDKHIHSMDLA